MSYKKSVYPILLFTLALPMTALPAAYTCAQNTIDICDEENALAKQDISDLYWVLNGIITEMSKVPGLTPDGLVNLLVNDPTEFVLKLKHLQTIKPHECLTSIFLTTDYNTAYNECLKNTGDVNEAWTTVDKAVLGRIKTIMKNRARLGITRSADSSILASCAIISDPGEVIEVPSVEAMQDIQDLLTWQAPPRH
jgi:hypothetical protein